MTQKSVGRTLLIGAFLTLLWTLIAPRYQWAGQSQTITMVPVPSSPSSRQSETVLHIDTGKFAAGLIIIWTTLFGIALLDPLGSRTPDK